MVVHFEKCEVTAYVQKLLLTLCENYGGSQVLNVCYSPINQKEMVIKELE